MCFHFLTSCLCCSQRRLFILDATRNSGRRRVRYSPQIRQPIHASSDICCQHNRFRSYCGPIALCPAAPDYHDAQQHTRSRVEVAIHVRIGNMRRIKRFDCSGRSNLFDYYQRGVWGREQYYIVSGRLAISYHYFAAGLREWLMFFNKSYNSLTFIYYI
jgi:hypothetical protein